MLTWQSSREALPVLALRVSPEHLEGDLVAEADVFGVETEVLIALGTDARVADAEVPEGKVNRGWWGDAYAQERGPLGSRLWLLESATATEDNALRAEQAVAEACAPIVRERRARAITPRAELAGDRILVTIDVTLLDGKTKTVGPVRVN